METLLALRDDALPSAEAAALRRHVDVGCPTCQQRLTWLAQNLPALADALATPPAPSPETLTAVRSLARLLPRSETRPGLARYIAQALSAPPHALVPLAGARGAKPLQRLFETDFHLLTLWDEPDAGPDHYLIGQVYARGGGALVPQSVTLLGDKTRRDALCEDSEFHLEAVPPGAYLLRCEISDAEIYLPRIVIGA